MYCTRKVTDDLTWVGADDRRLACFEGVYGVPDGVSYNSYLLLDEKTVLFDTVDKAVSRSFFENIAHTLGGRGLDYLVISHMEPDHAATVEELTLRYPDLTIICNAKIKTMLGQFFELSDSLNYHIVAEGDTFSSGKHNFTFVMAPMVHWPEVMMTYDLTDKILFSADAFGTFGALNGHLFNDEVDFFSDYLSEARRYYTNIVGKYGAQVQAVLKKAAGLELNYVCPLHGFVWRSHFGDFLEKYLQWSSYTPEVKGVMIAYASVYGHTREAADLLAERLSAQGLSVRLFDLARCDWAEAVAQAFASRRLVLAATTYNADVFPCMRAFIGHLTSRGYKGRTVALMENGSWAPQAAKVMQTLLESSKDITLLEPAVRILSALSDESRAQLEQLAQAIVNS